MGLPRAAVTLALCLLHVLMAQGESDEFPVRRHIRPADLPAPYGSRSVANPPKVVPRPDGSVLSVPAGFMVQEVATGLDQPRMMALAPNGDLFLTEPGADRLSVHRDENGDGIFDRHWTFSEKLNRPFGLVFIGNWIYIGNTDALVRLSYVVGQTESDSRPQRIVKLPSGGHWTRGLLYLPGENKLYISVGSKTNISEEPPQRAAILRCNLDGSELEIFASGLRNPVGLALQPVSKMIWAAVNERDGLGDDLVPDYATSVVADGFYGWPYSYIGSNPMPGYADKRPDLVKRAIIPDVLFQSHSAALGIAFYTGDQFPERYRGGAFVAFHGSWNRKQRTGYEVVYLPFNAKGQALGHYEEFLTGWRDTPSEKLVWGRPVGVLMDNDGSLLVSDDGNDKLWRVRYAGD